MRKHTLLSATALGLILSGLIALPAAADTTISTATTAPVSTSTTGNLTVDASGSITLTSGTAITVDSDNTVTLNGAISMTSSASNSTGILINGGHTSGLTINANIAVTDDFTPTDTSSPVDGVVDYPFATGSGRYGIHSVGATPFIGDVSQTATSIIAVEGDNSYGIRFENRINGKFTSLGTVGLYGDNNTAISLENGATGNVYLSGTINYVGKNSRAVNLTGDYSGAVEIDGAFTGTGYATTTPSSLLTSDQISALPANDLLQGGALVTIGGNVANGVLINAVPTTDSTNTSTDQDGDGQTDTAQKTAALTQYGSAPALLIGSASNAITLGGVVYNSSAVSPPSVNYGLLVRGSIVASGLYANIGATAIQLGGLGQSVTIANGIGIKGAVSAQALGADSTALQVNSGVTTPRLDVTGAISSSVVTGKTNPTGAAYGIDIKAGATLPVISVSGSVVAAGSGSTSSSTAIRDQSNTLTTIQLTGTGNISSTRTASDDDGDGVADTITHVPVAIDTSTNTTALNLTITDATPTDQTDAGPGIAGGILLGSGNDTIALDGGTIIGNIDFGAGSNAFTITSSGGYIGRLTSAGTIAFDLSAGTAALATGTSVNASSFHVGATSALGIVVDTAHPSTPIFTVAGPATFDNGAKLNIQLNNILLSPQSFTLLTASTINLGSLVTDLEGTAPYIYHAGLSTNAGNTALQADFRLKTQAEGGYSDNQFAALVPVLTAISGDPNAITAIMTKTTKATFDPLFNQYLPDYSGENLLTLAQGNEALNQSLAALTLVPDNNGGQYWLQEYGFQTTRKAGDTAGFKATTFSFAGGRETRLNDTNMMGVYIGLTSSSPLDSYAIAKEALVNSDLTIGGYWRVNTGAFKGWAHAGLGFAQFDSTRQLLDANVAHVAKAKWDGYSYSAGLGASYAMRTGFLDITPQVLVDYYNLNEGKHTETGGTDFFDLTVAERNSNMLSSQAIINVAYNQWFVKPELWVGWRQNVSANIADTVTNFVNGTPFTLTGGDVTGGGPVAGFRFSADNQWSFFSFEGNYRKLDAYTDYSLALRTRFQF
jgi:hypothetical protein